MAKDVSLTAKRVMRISFRPRESTNGVDAMYQSHFEGFNKLKKAHDERALFWKSNNLPISFLI